MYHLKRQQRESILVWPLLAALRPLVGDENVDAHSYSLVVRRRQDHALVNIHLFKLYMQGPGSLSWSGESGSSPNASVLHQIQPTIRST